MKLGRRERILAAATGGLLLLLVARFVLGGGSGASLATLREQREQLTIEVDKKKATVRRAAQLSDRLAAWQRRSLPADADMAPSLYQTWLRDLADQTKLQKVRVEAGGPRPHGEAYTTYGFKLRAQANLEQLVRFLHGFYSAGNLDQIRHITLKPLERTSDLDILLTIEALWLPGADRRKELAKPIGGRLAREGLDSYLKVLAQRQPFAAYRPAETRSEAPSEPPKFDPGRLAYLTAVLVVNDRPQAWIRSRLNDQTYMLDEGQKFPLGNSEAIVRRIGTQEVVLEIEGNLYSVPLGHSVRDGVKQEKPSP